MNHHKTALQESLWARCACGDRNAGGSQSRSAIFFVLEDHWGPEVSCSILASRKWLFFPIHLLLLQATRACSL